MFNKNKNGAYALFLLELFAVIESMSKIRFVITLYPFH